VGLTVFTALALAVMIGLGVWQLQRLAWKRELLAQVETLRTAPARDVGAMLDQAAEGRDVAFIRVRATCPGLASAPFVELYGLYEGRAGSRLISACAIESGHYRTVLVDRGFVEDVISARPPVNPQSSEPVEIVGVLRAPEKATFATPPNQASRWFSRDVAAMAAQLKAPDPAPVFLMAETSSNPDWKALKPAPLPAQITNRHLEYAMTWFGLAAALAGVYAAVLLKRRKS
jgi:surfeit locus 1 family protein